MEISPSAGQTGSPLAQTSAQTSGLSSDFETFLQMLTTQMRNQDPLNPVDSADFAVQLATFSTVEQQVLTNDLLSGLGAQLNTLGMAQLSGWVGMVAQARMPAAFDGQPVRINVTATLGADRAELVARDSNGVVVSRQNVPAQSGPLLWDGTNSNGAPLVYGVYDLELVSFLSGNEIGSNAAEVQDEIVEARSENGQTILVMAGGQRVPATEILSLQAPQS